MSKQKALQVKNKLKAKASLCVVTWPSTGMGKAATTSTPESVYGFLTSRKNRITGESTTYVILAATRRSIVGAKITIGGRTYSIKEVRELRPNDVLVMQEADLA